MGVAEDFSNGKMLMPWFAGFLHMLYAEGLSKNTFAQYRDNLWLLGGSIITQVSSYEEYQDDPFEKLAKSVANDGIMPDGYSQMSRRELKAFESMCRRFEKYLGESV